MRKYLFLLAGTVKLADDVRGLRVYWQAGPIALREQRLHWQERPEVVPPPGGHFSQILILLLNSIAI